MRALLFVQEDTDRAPEIIEFRGDAALRNFHLCGPSPPSLGQLEPQRVKLTRWHGPSSGLQTVWADLLRMALPMGKPCSRA